MATNLTARHLVDLSAALDGYPDPVSFGVDCQGAIWATARRSTEKATLTKGGAIFPKSKLATPTEHVVLCWKDNAVERLTVVDEETVFSYVQPWPGGALLVGARCYWRATGAEKNALAVTWSGKKLGRFTFGDGIEDVRATPNGTIWVSYFDEGVFGNYGWNDPGPAPVGAAGLCSFKPDGEIDFRYDGDVAKTDSICDAYALNVAGDDDVWIYFYTEFSIVRICKQKYHVWKTRLSGGHALAVSGNRALLYGDYQKPNLCRVLELGPKGTAKLHTSGTIVDENGAALKDVEAQGVGQSLYLFANRSVFVLDQW